MIIHNPSLANSLAKNLFDSEFQPASPLLEIASNKLQLCTSYYIPLLNKEKYILM